MMHVGKVIRVLTGIRQPRVPFRCLSLVLQKVVCERAELFAFHFATALENNRIDRVPAISHLMFPDMPVPHYVQR